MDFDKNRGSSSKRGAWKTPTAEGQKIHCCMEVILKEVRLSLGYKGH